MTTIPAKLVKDGNSTALRLPKQVLQLSGLHDAVELEVSEGQITVRAARNPREGWEEQIRKEIETNGPLTYKDGYGDMLAEIDATIADGLDDASEWHAN